MTSEGPPGGFGKWSQAGVPHRGWSCIDTEDLGSPDLVCEMCERQDVRYVHYMQHPDYPSVLQCGCICAGHMEENLTGAQRRDETMRSASRRRRAWPDRKSWKLSQKGNFYIKAEGYQVTVFQKGSAWSAVNSQPSTGFERFARRSYPTVRSAQLAAFDALMFLQSSRKDS
jgi:hypothetical protein